MTDPRVRCINCANYRASRCNNAKRALLHRTNAVAEIGTTFANLPQHCGGFAEKKQEQRNG